MSRAVVLTIGGIGLLLVARAALFYARADAVAFNLVLLIGAGLVAGLVELVLRLARATSLTRELAALPRSPTLEQVERASAPLAELLRARISGTSAAPTPAMFTPYLLGLLVMIGLLGTFLGLFETLRGAREALTGSGDVNALRVGLAAPMLGLSRAFGTSAAGVAASATLGLAAVFVRREEARFVGALAGFAAGPLAPLTIAGRELAALEAIARQGEALPAAAGSMREVVQRLETLERSWVAEHAKSSAEGAHAIRALASEMRADLERGVARAAEVMGAAIEPRVEAMVARVAAAAASETARWSEREDARVARLDALARVRADADLAHAAKLDALLEARRAADDAAAMAYASVAEARREADAAHAQAIGGWRDEIANLASKLVATVEGMEQGQLARADDAARRLDAQVALDASRAERLDAVLATFAATAEGAAAAARARGAAAAEGLAERFAAFEARLDSARAASIAGLAAHLERHVAALAAQADAQRAVDATRSAELDGASRATLVAVADAARETRDASREVTAALAAQLANSLAALERAHGERAADLARDLAAHASRMTAFLDERRAADAEAATRGEAALRETLAAFAAAGHEVVVASGQAATEVAVELAQEVAKIEAAHASRAAEISARHDAQLLREASRAEEQAKRDEDRVVMFDTLLERFTETTTAVADGARAQGEKLTAALARELAAFEGRVDAGRVASGDALAAKLAEHARGVGDELAATTIVVREAADLVRGGGAELSAVAEMFTTAVDRYREANDAWMLTLGKMDEGMERLAKGEAADLLGEYLEQTRDVYSQSLRFQRELFSELRALRNESEDLRPRQAVSVE